MSESRQMRRARHRAEVKAARREQRPPALRVACAHPAPPHGVGGDGHEPLVECPACRAVVAWLDLALEAVGPNETRIRVWCAPGFEDECERAVRAVLHDWNSDRGDDAGDVDALADEDRK